MDREGSPSDAPGGVMTFFADSSKTENTETTSSTVWKVLVVDDEEDVHELTARILSEYSFLGCPVVLFNAYSAAEAEEIISSHPDISLVLLDIVMETDDAGFCLIDFIREKQKNDLVQIIVRTGQPGYAPEKEVITKYNINSYLAKTELTIQKLFTAVTASLRSYNLAYNLKTELQSHAETARLLEISKQRTFFSLHNNGICTTTSFGSVSFA